VAGWEGLSAGELILAGERIVAVEKLLNLRLGAGRADDDLPDRFTEERVPDAGPTQGMTVDIQALVRDFYAAMQWDAEGVPTPCKLAELGLADLTGLQDRADWRRHDADHSSVSGG
jgi:aldehyde:ferredoxin oxidoreductase